MKYLLEHLQKNHQNIYFSGKNYQNIFFFFFGLKTESEKQKKVVRTRKTKFPTKFVCNLGLMVGVLLELPCVSVHILIFVWLELYRSWYTFHYAPIADAFLISLKKWWTITGYQNQKILSISHTIYLHCCSPIHLLNSILKEDLSSQSCQ